MLFRALAEGLRLLGRVDPSKSDLVLLSFAVEQRDGVAVGNADHAALENVSPLTAILAFIVWWGFLTGHVVNNIMGFGS